jgi:hypothetical protein
VDCIEDLMCDRAQSTSWVVFPKERIGERPGSGADWYSLCYEVE